MSEWLATRGVLSKSGQRRKSASIASAQFDQQRLDAHVMDQPHHVIDADKGNKRLARGR
ncbi:hypothetical protein PHISP_08588, partial [Aspergillus sp. HF37]